MNIFKRIKAKRLTKQLNKELDLKIKDLGGFREQWTTASNIKYEPLTLEKLTEICVEIANRPVKPRKQSMLLGSILDFLKSSSKEEVKKILNFYKGVEFVGNSSQIE